MSYKINENLLKTAHLNQKSGVPPVCLTLYTVYTLRSFKTRSKYLKKCCTFKSLCTHENAYNKHLNIPIPTNDSSNVY